MKLNGQTRHCLGHNYGNHDSRTDIGHVNGQKNKMFCNGRWLC